MNRNVMLITVLALSLPWLGCKKSTVVKVTTSMPTTPTELQIKWPVGRHLVESLNLKQTAEVTVPGMPAPMKQDMDMTQKYSLTVLKEREAGGHELEMKFLGTRMTMRMGDRNVVDYDSGKKSPTAGADPIADIFGKLMGVKLRYLLDASNRVEKVEGIESWQNELAGGAGGPGNELVTIFKNVFSEEYFKQMMDAGRNLPDKPVLPGDSWPVKQEIPTGELGTLIMDYTYTFQTWERRDNRYCARIGIEGTVSSKTATGPKTTGMSMTVESGKSSGETWFDLDMGTFVETAVSQDIKMIMTIPVPQRGNAPAAKPQTISNVIHQDITIKLESVK